MSRDVTAEEKATSDDPSHGVSTADYSPLSLQAEEAIDHIGFGQLEALGGSSASLGLISTLVFSLCVDNIGDIDTMEEPLKFNFLCLATAFSTYTTCYSLLEYYYVQVFIGVDRFMGGRVNNESVTTDRAKLNRDVRAIFAKLNTQRGAARNSMWLGLLSLVASSIAHIEVVRSAAKDLTPSAASCYFFCSVLCLVGPAWYATGAPDFKYYTCASIAGALSTAAEVKFVSSKVYTSDIVGLCVLACIIAFVPYTVMSFRGPLAPLVRAYSQVY
eukprot:TRINITY_DN12191_c0_g1_i1.p1 TRINITY_DN12191_c0_g1~~TRINITY_DN12191_c0_g1_i1.p1  ORF type:complete len:273 (+),score=41.34 TRINITY_DN12191_c0_g1_i1:89-907(+)